MAYKQRTYPYPVLNPYTDDFRGDLELSMTVEPVEGSNHLDLGILMKLPKEWEEYVIDNPQVVQFAIDVYSPETLTRRVLSLEPGLLAGTVQISADEMAGMISVTPIALASKAMADYAPAGMHEDFSASSPFDIERGDLMAFGESQRVYISLTDEQVTKSVFEFDVVFSDSLPDVAYEVGITPQFISVRAGRIFLDFFKRYEHDEFLSPNLFLGFYIEVVRAALDAATKGDDISDEISTESLWFQRLSELIAALPDEVQEQGNLVLAQVLVAEKGLLKLSARLIEGDKDE
jgi:hypothetical protein